MLAIAYHFTIGCFGLILVSTTTCVTLPVIKSSNISNILSGTLKFSLTILFLFFSTNSTSLPDSIAKSPLVTNPVEALDHPVKLSIASAYISLVKKLLLRFLI